MNRAIVGFVCVLGLSAVSLAGPETEGWGPGQAVADAIRQFAGTEAAFMPAGMLKSQYDAKDLSSLLQYPTDELAVVSLRGSQIRQALERSVSLYPASNTGFLQLSGCEATFSRSAPPEKRITSVSINGSRLDDSRSYSVAMPAALARGGLGYFKVWDRSAIGKTFPGQTLESILKDKAVVPTPSRWTATG